MSQGFLQGQYHKMTAQILEHDWYDKPLPENVIIGKRSWLYSSFAFLHYASNKPLGLSVGQNSGLYIDTFFELGPEGELSIGNYTAIVKASICTNKKIIIGDYVFIAHDVVIADSPFAVPFDFHSDLFQHLDKGSPEQEISIVIGNNAWICARAILLEGARIGEGSIVAAAAVVDFEVPPYSIVAGSPSKIVGWIKK
jgi:acetyltransferase-like isoleucine patch superfamily enzyme